MFVGLRTDRQTDGHCRNRDLLREEMEAGSADSKRLDLIRGMAREIATELSGCQCRLLEAVRSVGGQKHYVV
jgi:hypothetical protein